MMIYTKNAGMRSTSMIIARVLSIIKRKTIRPEKKRKRAI
jgi:hypothetical protein